MHSICINCMKDYVQEGINCRDLSVDQCPYLGCYEKTNKCMSEEHILNILDIAET